MALPVSYTTGTATVNNATANVTGQGTTWLTSGIEAGDMFWAAGMSVRIASVDSNTSITLAYAWPGASINESAYEIRYTPEAQRVLASARAVLDNLSSGNVGAIADLETAADTLAYFTGQGQAGVTGLTEAARDLLDDADAEAMRATLELGNLAEVSGSAGGRRNAFINPFFDVAQGYEATVNVNGSGLLKLPIDMVAFSGISGGEWNISLVDFDPGQTEVPGNPKQFMRIEQPVEPAAGYPYMSFVIDDVSTLAGQDFVVSFYARVLSGTCSVVLQCNQRFGTGGSPDVFNVPLIAGITFTTEWQRFVLSGTLGDITGKTIGPGNWLEIRIGVGNTGKLRGDFCGLQVEPGNMATPLNPISKIEAEALCRRYYERVPARALIGSRPVACLPKRATPSISTTVGSVANALPSECILTHDAAADAVVTFDARL